MDGVRPLAGLVVMASPWWMDGGGPQSVERVRAMVVEARAEGKPRKSSGNAAIYGMTTSLPGGPINEMLKTYTDVVLKT